MWRLDSLDFNGVAENEWSCLLDYPKLVGGCSCFGASVEWLLLPLTERSDDGTMGEGERGVSTRTGYDCRRVAPELSELSASREKIPENRPQTLAMSNVSAMRPQIVFVPFILGDK